MNSFFKYLGMVAFALLPALSSAALQSGKVQVGKTRGTVSLVDAQAQRKPLASGAVFQEGSKVETGADSSAELIFSNGSSVLLTPGTLFEVRTFRQIAAAGIVPPYRKIEKDPSPSITELEVLRGKIIGEARKLNAMSAFTVKTPDGLVRIRGAVFTVEYRVGTDGMGYVVADCVRGSVETNIFSSDAGPVSVEPGMQLSSAVPSAALVNDVAKASRSPKANASNAIMNAKLSQPVQIMLYPIPAEDMAAIAAFLSENSTLPEEVAATVNAMAQSMPTRAQIFGGGVDGAPAKGFGVVISGAQVTDTVAKEDKSGAPGGPTNTTTGGSSASDGRAPVPGIMAAATAGGATTLDATIKKITDNVSRMVEANQVHVTPTGG
jgi:hypothetical protein